MSGCDLSTLKTRIFAFLGDHVKISLFLIFNSILPLTDVFTDSFTSYDLYTSGHVLWAILTFSLMWNPFIVHLAAFVFYFFKHKFITKKEFHVTSELKRVVFFFPYFTPIRNIYYAKKLYKLRFGMRDFQAKNAEEVERIQHQAGSAGMYESLLEAGPQCVVQLKIILSTGSISYAQMASLPVSIFSLAWASSRAYFIQRADDYSDPDPDVVLLAKYIFPWMLLVVVHSLTIWTCIAGLLGGFVIPCIAAYPLIAASFQIADRCFVFDRKRLCKRLLILFGLLSTLQSSVTVIFILANHKFYKSSLWLSLVPPTFALLQLCLLFLFALFFVLAKFVKSKSNESDPRLLEKPTFIAKSILTSLWLPSIVGRKPFTFLISSMTSHIYKNFLFLLAVLLNFSKLIQTNVFLLWCVDIAEIEMYKSRNLLICNSLYDCFTWSTTSKQKVHVCNGHENIEFFYMLVFLLSFLSLLSAFASVQLENCTDYRNLYNSTKSSDKPVIHRSLLFTLASKDEYQELLKEALEDAQGTELINKQRRGETPLHHSCSSRAVKCTETLLRKGALLLQNGKSKTPPVIELAVEEAYGPILDAVAHVKHINPDTNHLSDNDLIKSLQQQARRDMKRSLYHPKFVRSMVNLLLPTEIKSEDFLNVPELEFLVRQMRARTPPTPTLQTINSMLCQRNQKGQTVLQDPAVDQPSLKVMLALAWSVADEMPELVPDLKTGILNLRDDLHFIETQDNPLKTETLIGLMMQTDAQGRTILQEEKLAGPAYQTLLALALSASEASDELLPEVRREIAKAKNKDLLKDLPKPQVVALVTYQNETMVPILHDKDLSAESYKNLITMTLPVLADVISAGILSSEEDRKREKEGAELAVKILPQLLSVRPEEKERVSRQLRIFSSEMKTIMSSERNASLKTSLANIPTLPTELRKELGLK